MRRILARHPEELATKDLPSSGRSLAVLGKTWGCARDDIRGFTLLEILIALSVFAILATITSSAMYHAFNTRTRVAVHADRLNTLQLAIALIQHDTQQMVARSVLGKELHVFPPFTGQPAYVEFTHTGDGILKRVAYLCRNGQLIRRSWEVLDTPVHRQYQDKLLLDNLKQCGFAYLAHNQQILPDWQEYAVKQDQHQETLPSAIQFTLTLIDWGSMHLLFVIPEARNA